ncbi:hypothetical protein ABMA28_016617, partial [Loxostege sticticalis]
PPCNVRVSVHQLTDSHRKGDNLAGCVIEREFAAPAPHRTPARHAHLWNVRLRRLGSLEN